MAGFISNWSQDRVIAIVYAPGWLLTDSLCYLIFLTKSAEHLKYLLGIKIRETIWWYM